MASAATAPTVTSSAADGLGTTAATLHGNVTADGGASVTDRGFCYKTSSGVTITDNKTVATEGATGTGAITLTPALGVNVHHYFKAYAINSVNTTLSAEQDFWTLANPPAAPTVGNPTTSSLDVTIGSGDGNPPTTICAIQETTSGNYVQANGSLSGSAVYQTASTWGTRPVTGLAPSTTYTFKVKAQNGAGTDTAFGPSASGTTASASVPTISASPTTLSSALNTTYGTASAETSFNVSGAAMNEGVLVTPPSGFEVSLTSGGVFTDSVTAGAAGTIASTPVYVRLKGTATASGSPYSGNIQLTSSGATPVNVATVSSTVAQKGLTITGIGIADKDYDRGLSATITGTAAYSGLVNGESFAIEGTPSASFVTATAGAPKATTITGYQAPSANYAITQPSGFTAQIRTIALTVTGASAANKTYDGVATTTISGASLVGVISGDTVTLSTVGTFADASVGAPKTVTLALVAGGDSANYTLTQPTPALTADITKANQAITFGALPAKTTADADFAPGATLSPADLAVSYDSSNTGVATITGGNLIHIAGAGTTTITASQAGDANHNAATPVPQTLTVTVAPTLYTWDCSATTPTSGSSANIVSAAAGNTQGHNNGTTTLITTVSASSGYTGFSGTSNFGAASVDGSLSTSSSTYFSLVVSPAAGYQIVLNSLSLGSRSTSSGPTAITVYSSIDNYAAAIGSAAATANSTWALKSVTFSGASLAGASGTPVTLRIYGSGGSGSSVNTANWRVDDVKLTVTANPIPTISTSGSLSALSTTYGTASAESSFNVSGSTMNAGILVTPPTGFEVSLNSGGVFTDTVTAGAAGAISPTPVYVRLKATATLAGSPYSGNVQLTSSGATAVNVPTVSSSVAPKGLTITGIGVADKDYDRTTAATITGTAAYSGLVNGDSFAIAGSPNASFTTETAGLSKATTISGYLAPSANYTVTQPSDLTAQIRTVALTITANNVTKLFGTALTSASGSTEFTSRGLVSGDVIDSVTISYGSGSAAGDAAGPYTGSVTASLPVGAAFSAANYDISYTSGDIIVSAAPTISVVGALSAVNTTYGTASAPPTSFSVFGGNLSGDLTVGAPAGFEVSTVAGSGYAGSLDLTASGGTVNSTIIYVRLAATTAAGAHSGNVTVSGGGATAQEVATVSSTVAQKGLTITGIGIADKDYDRGVSATITGTAAYSGLVNGESFAIEGTPSASFVTATAGAPKATTITGYQAPSANYSITQPSGLTAQIRTIALTVTGASAMNKTYDGVATTTISGGSLVGVIDGDTVTLSTVGTFANANADTTKPVTLALVAGGDSANYTLTQPAGLTADIARADQTITFAALSSTTTVDPDFALGATVSPADLTVSYASSTPAVATIINDHTVHIVGAGTTTITASQAGDGNHNAATPVARTLTVTATSTLLTSDEFDYAAGAILTDHGWIEHSGGGVSPIKVQSPGLEYASYASSGIGLAASLQAASGQDANKAFTAKSSGSLYLAALVKVSAATTGGDYILHLNQSDTAFFARIYVKRDASSNLAFGTTKNNGTVQYTSFSYSLNAIYLVAVKYTFNAGAQDDTIALYINPTPGAAEPTATIGPSTDATADATSLSAVSLRQGGASSTPAVLVDGIRVATTWADAVAGTACTTPADFAVSGGSACSSVGVTVGLAGSESGVSYQLYRDASTVGSPWSGDGNTHSFGLQTLAGTYTVVGTRAVGSCTLTMFGSATVIATPDPTIMAPSSVCVDSTGNAASVVDAGVGATYVWGITGGGITAGGGTRAITFAAGASGSVVLNCTISAGGCSSGGAQAKTVPIGSPDATITAAGSVCGNSIGNLASVPDAGLGASYAWAIGGGGTITAGSTARTVTFTVGASGAVTLNCVVTSGSCSSGGLQNQVVSITPTVTPSVSIVAVPGTSIASGVSVTFTATPAQGGASPAYQWKKNNVNVGTGTTYTDAGLVNGDQITCVMTASADVCPLPATAQSNTLTMTVTGGVVEIAKWDFTSLTGGPGNFGASPLTPTAKHANVTVVGLTRGSGIGTGGPGAAKAWGGDTFTVGATDAAAAISANEHVTFSITVGTGYTMSLTGIPAYNIRRSGSGPTTGIWQYKVDSGAFVDIGSQIGWGADVSSAGNPQASIDLSGIAALQSLPAGTVVTFRILAWGATGTGGTWYLSEPSGSTPLIVNGTMVSGVLDTPTATAATAVTPSQFTANWGSVDGATDYLLDVSLFPTFTAPSLVVSSNCYHNGQYSMPGWTELPTPIGTSTNGGDAYILMIQNTGKLISPAMDFNASQTERLNFRARTFGGTSGSSADITVSISTDNGSNWASLGTRTAGGSMASVTEFDLSSYSGTQVKIKLESLGATAGKGVGVDDVIVNCQVASGQAAFVTGYHDRSVGNVTTFDVTGMEPETTFYYRVRATSVSQTSDSSNVITVRTPHPATMFMFR